MKYKIIVDEKEYYVDVGDIRSRPVLANVNGQIIEVWPETMLGQNAQGNIKTVDENYKPIPTPNTFRTEQIRKDKGLTSDRPFVIRAPIPGIINRISISLGDVVEIGQELCVLEAMKMNNLIRAPQKGKIVIVHVNIGQHVKHGDPLMELD